MRLNASDQVLHLQRLITKHQDKICKN